LLGASAETSPVREVAPPRGLQLSQTNNNRGTMSIIFYEISPPYTGIKQVSSRLEEGKLSSRLPSLLHITRLVVMAFRAIAAEKYIIPHSHMT